MRIRNKLLAMFCMFVVLLGIAVLIFVQSLLSRELKTELIKRGVSLSKHYTEMVTDHVLTENIFSLQMLTAEYMESDENIEYIFIIDKRGTVLVHTFGDAFPVDLMSANIVEPKQAFNIQALDTEKGNIFDIAVPILRGEAGVVRTGMSAEPIKMEVARLTKQIISIILLVLLIGALIVSGLTIAIIKPISELEEAAEIIGSGDLSHRVLIRTKDEIGRLSETFNKMAENLEGSNKELTQEITERKHAEEKLKQALDDKDMLMKEVHHRVKNNFVVIQSLLALQMKDISDVKSKAYFADTQNRVKSMTMIHEMLHKSDDITKLGSSEYIRKIINTLFSNYKVQTNHIKLRYDIDDIELDVDTMIPLGLIINELVSNALKYAFPDDMKGELDISMKRAGKGNCELVVKDTGVGLPEDFDMQKVTSLGLIIVNFLVSQIDGSLEVSNEDGTEFRVSFREKPIR
ncbi:MAG: HAMP domain-containing protein [Thermodesulfovibrionales bacterium]|nr:HAMP domain-containing protein [Thermodesulfovibrionales bacterium]